MRRALIACVAVLFLAACDPTIDGSSEEKFQSSLEKIADKMGDADKKRFGEALQIMMFSQMDFGAIMAGNMDADSFKNDAMKTLNGMKAKEVMAAADKIVKARETEQIKQARTEIDELKAAVEKAQADAARLAKVEVLKSRFYMQKESYRDQPVIDVTVKNGSDAAIARLYFEGTLASPKRSVPWIKDKFSYEIPGGLEPGEEKRFELAPNRFSDWGKKGGEAPKDAVFTATIVQFEDAEGKTIGATDLEAKKERLEKLIKAITDNKPGAVQKQPERGSVSAEDFFE